MVKLDLLFEVPYFKVFKKSWILHVAVDQIIYSSMLQSFNASLEAELKLFGAKTEMT